MHFIHPAPRSGEGGPRVCAVGGEKQIRSRGAALRPSYGKLVHESHSHLPPQRTKGGGAPEGAMSWSRATRYRCCHLIALRARQRVQRDALASRRSTAALAKTVTPWLNPGPRFLELPGANGRTLPGASAASTSQTGRSAGRYDARSRPGAGLRDRARGPHSLPQIGSHPECTLHERAGW